VIVVDIDHQAAQQIADLAGYFDLELIQFPWQQMIGNVVVGEIWNRGSIETFTDAQAHGGQLAGNARGKGGCHG
jgi:hypothetical protein